MHQQPQLKRKSERSSQIFYSFKIVKLANMMNKPIRYGMGISIILLGIAGLFLPILQGILLITLGILVIKGGGIRKNWNDLKKKVKPNNKKD